LTAARADKKNQTIQFAKLDNPVYPVSSRSF
jgi:hypothetical protein